MLAANHSHGAEQGEYPQRHSGSHTFLRQQPKSQEHVSMPGESIHAVRRGIGENPDHMIAISNHCVTVYLSNTKQFIASEASLYVRVI